MRLRFVDRCPKPADFLGEALRGLEGGATKSLPPKFFYDERGSRLFEAICETEEYYLTRTELGILRRHAGDIAVAVGQGCTLIEPGSGNMTKVRLLLDALRPAAYLPLDISREQLAVASERLVSDYPWLEVQAVCVDYTRELASLNSLVAAGGSKRVVFFPGSTIGNFEPADAEVFLAQVRRLVGSGGDLLIGVDLKKTPHRLHRAYNDALGHTGQFNLNLLSRINSELGGDFELGRFDHYAFYNPVWGRIEMHLVSRGEQAVSLGGRRIRFADGESIHTENSYKFTTTGLVALASAVGFSPVDHWMDPDGWCAVCLFRHSGEDPY